MTWTGYFSSLAGHATEQANSRAKRNTLINKSIMQYPADTFLDITEQGGHHDASHGGNSDHDRTVDVCQATL